MRHLVPEQGEPKGLGSFPVVGKIEGRGAPHVVKVTLEGITDIPVPNASAQRRVAVPVLHVVTEILESIIDVLHILERIVEQIVEVSVPDATQKIVHVPVPSTAKANNVPVLVTREIVNIFLSIASRSVSGSRESMGTCCTS